MNSAVNIAPSLKYNDRRGLWQPWTANNGQATFGTVPKDEVFRISNYIGRVGWQSILRKIEPRKEYRLTAKVRGAARLVIQWVRVERQWESLHDGRFTVIELPLGEATGPIVREDTWETSAVGQVAPRDATHCRLLLEAVGEGSLTEFSSVYIDGLGIDPLEIHYCHTGYHPNSQKHIIVQLLGEAKEGSFTLIDNNGKEVLEEELELLDHRLWGRTFWRADFTDFHEEGSYALVAQIAGRSRRTKFFIIRKDVFTKNSELALQWFHAQRCGATVLEYHEACHTDDGVRKPSRGEKAAVRPTGVDASGGWHSSGGYEKDTSTAWIAIHALTHMYEKGAARGSSYGGKLPDALEECRWGVEYILKIATEDGRYSSGVLGVDGRDFYGPPELETDNRLDSGDERTVGPPCDWTTAALVSYSLANFARVVKPMNAQLARRATAAAEKTFAALARSKKPEDPLNLHSAAALLCIGMWRARELEIYREECSWRILSILQRQRDEGIFTDLDDYQRQASEPREVRVQLPRMTNPRMGVEYAPIPFLYLHALLCYLERSIDDALALEIRGALDKFFLRVREAAAISPFGQMGEFTIAEDPVNFPVMDRGYNSYYLSLSYLLAKASALLLRSDLGNIALRQCEWVLGRNVRSACMVVGAAHKGLGAYYTKYATVPENVTGYIPGGVVNGIIGGDGIDYPFDFPYLDIHWSDPEEIEEIHSGLDTDPRTNEYWLPNNAWFILACGEIMKTFADQQ